MHRVGTQVKHTYFLAMLTKPKQLPNAVHYSILKFKTYHAFALQKKGLQPQLKLMCCWQTYTYYKTSAWCGVDCYDVVLTAFDV